MGNKSVAVVLAEGEIKHDVRCVQACHKGERTKVVCKRCGVVRHEDKEFTSLIELTVCDVCRETELTLK